LNIRFFITIVQLAIESPSQSPLNPPLGPKSHALDISSQNLDRKVFPQLNNPKSQRSHAKNHESLARTVLKINLSEYPPRRNTLASKVLTIVVFFIDLNKTYQQKRSMHNKFNVSMKYKSDI